MNKKIVWLIGMFLIFLVSLVLAEELQPFNPDEPESFNYVTGDYSTITDWNKVDWTQIPAERINEVPKEHLDYNQINLEQRKAMNTGQLWHHIDKIEDLSKDVNPETAKEAIKEQTGIEVSDFGPGARVESGVLKSTQGKKDELVMEQKSGWMVTIDKNGEIIVSSSKKEVIDENGWFHTGDIGRIDPKNNCLYITGRIKSMIVLKSGKKIFPEEIEQLLGQFEFIKESMVWGEPEEDGEVDVWAKVVLDKDVLESQGSGFHDEKGIKEKMSQIIHAVNKKMPSFKSIRFFIFGEQEMEKTTTRKIKRMVELASIKDTLEKNKLKIKEITGRNIDALKQLISPSKTGDNDRDKTEETRVKK